MFLSSNTREWETLLSSSLAVFIALKPAVLVSSYVSLVKKHKTQKHEAIMVLNFVGDPPSGRRQII